MIINGYLCQRPCKLVAKLQRESSTSACNNAASEVLNKTMYTKLLMPLNLPKKDMRSMLNSGMLEFSNNKSDVDSTGINYALDSNDPSRSCDAFEYLFFIHQRLHVTCDKLKRLSLFHRPSIKDRQGVCSLL